MACMTWDDIRDEWRSDECTVRMTLFIIRSMQFNRGVTVRKKANHLNVGVITMLNV
jgi:hypothetical protein